MRTTKYVNTKGRHDVALAHDASAGLGGIDLVIEALDEFAPASTGRVSGLCLCATNADYVYGTAARN